MGKGGGGGGGAAEAQAAREAAPALTNLAAQ